MSKLTQKNSKKLEKKLKFCQLARYLNQIFF